MLVWIRRIVVYGLLLLILAAAAGLVWLRQDAHRPLESYWVDRHGTLDGFEFGASQRSATQSNDFITLTSDSGLEVSARVIRPRVHEQPLPVLMVLGGHRTGSDAVDLFGEVGQNAIIALDYPYHGPERVKGLVPVLETIPLARQGFLDTVPAVSLVIDWLTEQSWVDTDRIVVIGASLGVPFASTAAVRDERIDAVVLVHGAADNRLWLEWQVRRRVDIEFLHYPLGTILHWLAYGPALNTGQHVAKLSPRPVVIIGARHDERTPPGETERLFAAASEPKLLRWTEGSHVDPDRPEVIGELMAIAAEVLPLVGAAE